jgi:amino acid transporter
MTLVLWGVGGLLSFIGALCYAELATTYPRTGGDYVYLTRAFGRPVGFLFGWAQLAVVLPTSIGMMAFVFANYASRFWPAFLGWETELAFRAVIVLTALNVMGVTLGKRVQNFLTILKVIGVIAILVAGFGWRKDGASWKPAWPEQQPGLNALGPFAVALILILYAYGGWNDAAFVAAEVRDVRRNLSRALFLGVLLITLIYVAVNAAYINALGYAGMKGSEQVAADVLALPFGNFGEMAMCAIVMVSALGAMNGLCFTGARVYAALGRDHPVLGWLSPAEEARGGGPVVSLIIQALITTLLIYTAGSPTGKEMVHHVQGWVHEQAGKVGLADWIGLGESTNWSASAAFNYLFGCSAPVFWLFFLLTGISLFVLRAKDRDVERPFRVPLYPVVPALFCLSCALWLYRSIEYAVSPQPAGLNATGGLLVIGVLPLLVALPLYGVSRLLERGQAR